MTLARSSALALALALGAALLTVAGCHRAAGTTTERGGNSTVGFRILDLSPMEGDLATVLAREAATAKTAGLRPFVEIGATWCGPCQKLKDSVGDARMTAAFQGTYVVRLDLDAWQPQLLSAGLRVDVVPVFFQLGSDGKPTGKKLTGDAWSDDTPAGMAPVLKTFFNS